jgi:hypothetical protein
MQKMANPLFNALGGQQTNPMQQLIADAKRMKQTFTGNPKAEVQKLLNSGAMTQEQFNQYAQIANQLIGGGAFK